LEGAALAGPRPEKLRVEHDPATRRTVVLGIGPEVEDALADRHDALDHPIERTAIQDLVTAARRLPGSVTKLRRLAGTGQRFQPRGLPVPQILDGLDANAQLEKMHGHVSAP
jgi:hypothetical protein